MRLEYGLMDTSLYRQLPKVDKLLADPRLADWPHAVAVWAAREALEEVRAGIASGALTQVPDVAALAASRASLVGRGRLRPVLNATGVVVHTNLGRSAWPEEAVQAAAAAAGYCNLEMDLETGKRGGRLEGITAQLQLLTGCEAALVVNNCAAAVLLAVGALAGEGEVVVSRGELVEIGGSFRVPDVVASTGARLCAVGTTNRTRASDYAAAISPRTAVLMRVHPSNFRVMGFTDEAKRTELVGLARDHGLAMVEDVGSGSLDGLYGEPGVRQAIADGVDVALFSGDKLLGGPQTGIAVGRREAIRRMRRHPLYRALRVDKTILAALERTLALHAGGNPPPTLEMIELDPAIHLERTKILAHELRSGGLEVEESRDVGRVGGGSLPTYPLEGPVLRVAVPQVEAVARLLRTGDPAVVARVAEDKLVLDARCLREADLHVGARQVVAAVKQPG